MDRRRFLQTGLSLTALTALPAVADSHGDTGGAPAAFAAFLDTLLPRDRFGPAASELDLVDPAWNGLATLASDRRFLRHACQWLDQQADRPFAELDPTLRHRLVTWMAEQPAGEAPALFYARVRDRAVMLYFRHPEIQARLGMPHPPQPRGYVDDLMQHVARHDG